ncbi:hypothetical protein AVEN_116360-1, partial [Araneus ventricosus]
IWFPLYVCGFTYAVSFIVSMLFEIPVLNLLDWLGVKNDGNGGRMCSHCPETELSLGHIFDCPAVLRAWQGVCFSPAVELYSDKIVQIAKSVLYIHGFI